MALLKMYNGAQNPTIAIPKIATTAVLKTMMQIQASKKFRIVEWGASFDASALAVPGSVELLETGSVNATVTAYAAADINLYGDPDSEAVDTEHRLTLGASASGFTASAEGTVTAVNRFDQQLVSPTNQWAFQHPLGREAVVNHDVNLRIRCTFPVTVNCICYILIEI